MCEFVPWLFGLLAVPACTMTAWQTNNSLATSLDEENSDPVPHAESLAGPSSLASMANSAPQTSSVVSATVVAAGLHDPALIAAIVDAVKASLAAEKDPGPSLSNLHGSAVSVELQSLSGGIPTSSPILSQQTATLLAFGGTFPEPQTSHDIFNFNHAR